MDLSELASEKCDLQQNFLSSFNLSRLKIWSGRGDLEVADSLEMGCEQRGGMLIVVQGPLEVQWREARFRETIVMHQDPMTDRAETRFG